MTRSEPNLLYIRVIRIMLEERPTYMGLVDTVCPYYGGASLFLDIPPFPGSIILILMLLAEQPSEFDSLFPTLRIT